MGFKVLNDNGKEVVFSSLSFRNQVKEYQKRKASLNGKRISLDSIYNDIAEHENVSVEAVKNWCKGANGVGDISVVKSIAELMKIDYNSLLLPSGVSNNESIGIVSRFSGNDEKELLVQIYNDLIDIIYWFAGTESTSQAKKEMEHPSEALEKAIFDVYHKLDGMGLMLSEEVYLKLRRTVAEVEFITDCIGATGFRFPPEWREVNPVLASSEFYDLILYGYEYVDPWEDVVDAEVANHLLIEDLQDLINEMVEQNERGRSGDYTKMQVMDDERCYPYYESYKLVAREVSNTLRKLMQRRFDQLLK